MANEPPRLPGPYEVLGALERLTASEELRASPQLMAFLAFVVETTRRGDANRIKAYTIAVEALGRGADFDPETDSIVRVVAGRLRRALDKYYAEAGAGDPVVIELPRGSYVPVFRRRVTVPEPADAIAPQGASAPAATAEPQQEPDAGAFRRSPGRLQPVRLAAVAILAVALIALLITWNQSDRDVRASTSAALSLLHRSAPLLPAPVVLFQPFDEIGKPPPGPFTIDRVLGKLGDALGRFEGVNVVTGGGASARAVPVSDWPQYRLSGSADYHPDGTATLNFRLVDTSDGALVWSHIFDGLQVGAHPDASQETVVREVATAIAAPFGAIWASELNARDVHDPRRACVIELIEYWRKFNPALHERVRQCTERMVADNPADISGVIGTATVYLRNSYLGIKEPDKPPALTGRWKPRCRPSS